MALKSSTHETCSCVSPDAYVFKNLSSKQRQGLELLHQKEGLITKAECERIGSSKYLFFYGQCKVVAQIIPAKSISESLKICEIFELYQLLDNYDMKLTKVLVDVYHKEQLVTKEEAEEAASADWRWGKLAVTKDSVTATRIADILDDYGFNNVAQHIRVRVDVYHKEQLVTKDEVEEVASDVWKWGKLAITKDSVMAIRIADVLDKYGFNEVAQHIRVLVDVYHEEQLVTKEEAEKAASDKLKWTDIAVTKGSVTATRIADILDKYGFNDVGRPIRVLVDVYHKEQLVTKEEVEEAASDKLKWLEVAVTKDSVTATRIADILDEYGFKDVAQRIREPPSTLSPLISISSPRCSKPSRSVKLMSTTSQSLLKEKWVSYRSNPSRSVKLMSTTSQSLLKEKWVSYHKYSGLRPNRVTRSSTGVLSRKPRFSQYATSDTSVLDTPISKTSPDSDSSESKSQEKATIMRGLDTSETVSIVGKVSTNEELQRAFQEKDRSHSYEVPISFMSPEAVLSRKCWLPFGYDSITVGRRSGTYDLCSDGLTKLTIPRNAVRGETAEIRYAIIGQGPFQLPPNYQLGSFVVYVYYNPEEITRPITLSLPTWYGGDVVPGEPPPDGLSFAVAPHTLGLQDTQYTFQLIDRGEFGDSRVHDVSIDGHSSLFTTVFKEGASSLYLATHVMVKRNAKETTHNIFVTYAISTWIEIYKKIHGEDAINFNEQFKFENPPSGKLVGEVEETRGNGWAVAITGCPELHQKEISYENRGLKTVKQLRIAVKNELYPPKLTFSVASTIGRGERTTPKWVNCTIRGADRPLQFSTCVEERISGPSSPNPLPPLLHSALFDSGQFMDSYKEIFFRVVAAKDIAEKLRTQVVIPESVYRHILNQQTTDDDANLKLFRHLHQHGAPSTIRSLCDIMIQERGYPNMNTLGRAMSEHTSLPPPS